MPSPPQTNLQGSSHDGCEHDHRVRWWGIHHGGIWGQFFHHGVLKDTTHQQTRKKKRGKRETENIKKQLTKVELGFISLMMRPHVNLFVGVYSHIVTIVGLNGDLGTVVVLLWITKMSILTTKPQHNHAINAPQCQN
jgi:hypothetical protein